MKIKSYVFLSEVFNVLKPLRDSLETDDQKEKFSKLIDFIKDYPYEKLVDE
jgi:hypothetical protein